MLSRTISVFPGAPTGFFGARTDFAFNTNGALTVEMADFNKDGHLDLAFPVLNGRVHDLPAVLDAALANPHSIPIAAGL